MPIVKVSRGGKVILCILILILGFDIINYIRLSPALRVAKIETAKNPFADRISADDTYLKLFPIGSDKNFVLNSLKEAGFLGRIKLDDVTGKENYWGMAKIPAGITGTLLLLWYEVHISVDFVDGQLTHVEAFIFMQGI